MRSSVAPGPGGRQHQVMLTSQSVAAMIISGMVLMFLGVFGGGRFDVILVGAALVFGAGLFQTLDNRRAPR